MNVVLVHSRDTEKAENHIMHLEANAKVNNGMNDSKNSTIEKKESGHCAAIVPIWRVKDVHI